MYALCMIVFINYEWNSNNTVGTMFKEAQY